MTPPPGARDDAALVADALAGDDRAFTELMRRYKDMVYRLARRYSGDRDEAFDLVQETFVAAWSSLRDFDARRPMSAWLRHIALNKCRDWSRRRRVRHFFFAAESLDAGAAQSMTSEPSVDETGGEAALARLDVAVSALPPGLKEPLLLTVFEGLSYSDAAKVLGMSAKAIETRVYRAKKALARALGAE